MVHELIIIIIHEDIALIKEFSIDMCLKDLFQSKLKLLNLMEGEFQDHGQLDQDLEE